MAEVSKLNDCQYYPIPKVLDKRGNLSFFEGENHIPFEIKRAYWIYDVPGGMHRGGHACKGQQEYIIALSGSFDVLVDDGMEQKAFTLNRSYFGLYIPALMWRELKNFSTNAVALVVASGIFDESEYVRDFQSYISLRNNGK